MLPRPDLNKTKSEASVEFQVVNHCQRSTDSHPPTVISWRTLTREEACMPAGAFHVAAQFADVTAQSMALEFLRTSAFRLRSDAPLAREDGDGKRARPTRQAIALCFAAFALFNLSFPASPAALPHVVGLPEYPQFPFSQLNCPRCCPGTLPAPPRFVLPSFLLPSSPKSPSSLPA